MGVAIVLGGALVGWSAGWGSRMETFVEHGQSHISKPRPTREENEALEAWLPFFYRTWVSGQLTRRP